MPNRPSLNALRAFEAAVRRGSFAAAAAELRLTPSAISRHVQLLEHQLGVVLFHRSGRSVVSTDAGQSYYRNIHEAFGRITTATADLTGGRKSDRLSVHSAPSFATQWLLPRLSQFVAAHPELDVVFWATSPPYDCLGEPYDVAIQHGAKGTDGLDVLPFPTERIVPMCSPALADSVRPIRSAEDLAFHTLIHSDQCLVSLAGLAGASSRTFARSRQGPALRPIVHVNLHGRRRPGSLSGQHAARSERARERAPGKASRRRRPGNPSSSAGMPAGKKGFAESCCLQGMARCRSLRRLGSAARGIARPCLPPQFNRRAVTDPSRSKSQCGYCGVGRLRRQRVCSPSRRTKAEEAARPLCPQPHPLKVYR